MSEFNDYSNVVKSQVGEVFDAKVEKLIEVEQAEYLAVTGKPLSYADAGSRVMKRYPELAAEQIRKSYR